MAPIVALWGYFDEAGHPSDPNAHTFVLAGWIADEAQWTTLEAEWFAILNREAVRDDYGVTWFHWKDWKHGKDAFAGWGRERRAALLGELNACVQRNVRAAIGAWRQFDPGESRRKVRDVYRQAHVYVILSSVNYRQTAEQPIRFVFAHHPEINPTQQHNYLRDIYSRYDQIGDLVLADPRSKPALQAADLIASEIYAWLPSSDGGLPPSLRSLSVPFTFRGIQDEIVHNLVERAKKQRRDRRSPGSP